MFNKIIRNSSKLFSPRGVSSATDYNLFFVCVVHMCDMGFPTGCVINPVGCAIRAVRGKGGSSDSNSNSNSHSQSSRSSGAICNNRWLNLIPSTSSVTLALDRACGTNDSPYTGVAGDTFGVFMELLFGKNWLTYVRIVLAVIILVMALKLKRLLF